MSDLAITRWGPYVRQRIDDIRNGIGRDHWDAEWPSSVTAAAAWDWACQVIPASTPTPSVVPTEDGCIALVWRKNGWDVELEVDGESHAEAWCHDRIHGSGETLDLDHISNQVAFTRVLYHLLSPEDCSNA